MQLLIYFYFLCCLCFAPTVDVLIFSFHILNTIESSETAAGDCRKMNKSLSLVMNLGHLESWTGTFSIKLQDQ